jgi:Spy/CpxP family protein refolding chaperone
MNQRSRMRIVLWLMIVVVFGLGCVAGASLDSLYRSRASSARGERSPHGPDQMLETMRHDLNLNDQQSQQIRAILEDTRTQYRALRTEVRPRYDTIRQQARGRIRALLSPDQQQHFDAMIAERDARDAKRAEDGKEKHQ